VRRLGKVLGIVGIVLLLLVVTLTTYGAWTVKRSWPQTTGERALPGLHGTVDVLRDERGITNVYADNPDDLFYAQGYVHAQDRFYEMDFRRHITSGRLSEMFGKSQLDTDKFLRISGWRHVAEQEYALLSAETRRNLDNYAKGVNAYLADHSGATVSLEYAVLGLQNPGYTIEPWTAIDSIAWLKAMAWDLRGNMQEEIARSIISAGVGVARTAQLYPAYPYDRHRPIVATGAVVGGVFDANNQVGAVTADRATSVSLAAARPALERTSVALGSLDDVLGTWGPEVGSNSWVVSGANTESGKPLLANDPHLAPMMPSLWYQMGLHCRTVSSSCPYDVAGYTFSGVPGVVIGHNAAIGWGFTNLGPDVTDLVLEKVTGDTYLVGTESKPLITRQETIKVAGGDDVTITVRSTGHGPLVSDASDELTTVGQKAPDGGAPRGAGYAVALEWTALTPGATMNALTDLNVAQDWNQFRIAAKEFEAPAQNMIFASVATGSIGYQAPGKIPIRTGYDGRYPSLGWDPKQAWTGYIPFEALPNVVDPPDGFIVTANNAAAPRDYAFFLTDDWAYGARSQRITDLVTLAISGGGKMNADMMRAIQSDTWNENAAFVVPRIKATPVPDSTAKALALLSSWDFTQPADSAPAAYFNAFWSHLLLDTFGDEIPSDYLPDAGDRWFTVVRQLWESPKDPWWDDVTTKDKVETRDDAVLRALNEANDELTSRLGSDPTAWRWGDLHTLTVKNQTLGKSGIGPIENVFNRGPITTSGGSSIVNATGWTPSKGYQVDWVPSMRMVLDFNDLDASTWVNLTGNSGHAYNPHYVDQLDAWQSGRTYPFAFTPAAVQAAAKDHLVLTPA